MSAIDDLLEANSTSAAHRWAPDARPTKQLAVLTCMDARLDLLGGLGLVLGQAHILRNAGGIATADTLRSLAISQRALGTREIAIIQHTNCGMDGFDDTQFRATLTAQSGAAPDWDVPGFTDLPSSVRRSVQVVRDCPWLPHRDQVRGFVVDVDTHRLSEVE